MTNKTVIHFSGEEEASEVLTTEGRNVDVTEVNELLEGINDQFGRDIFRPQVVDCNVEGEDISVVEILENESDLALPAETLVAANEAFQIALADKGWVMENADPAVLESLGEEEDGEEDWDDSDTDDDDEETEEE